ncbi:hypothetical protein KA005_44400 [bacterium]|nr:hypothetical protein [bacterium]
MKALKVKKVVNFLIDTGANYSGITEKEATILGIDTSILPDSKKGGIGFGGTFRNKMINREVILTFQSKNNECKIKCSKFIVIHIPPKVSGKAREEMLRYTPNILGMDILSKFRLYLDKNQVELIK